MKRMRNEGEVIIGKKKMKEFELKKVGINKN